MPRTHDDIQEVNISVPIDTQLSKGFVVSAIIHLLLFFIFIAYVLYYPTQPSVSQLPMELIRLGLGNGIGSGGNLSAPGAPQKGEKPTNPLEDASKQQQVKQKVHPAEEYQPGEKIVATNVSNAKKSRDSSSARGTKNTGAPDGNPHGTGLRGEGNGPGSGLGFGIDWGGGGNRTVLNKVIPQCPPGCDRNAQILIQFTVLPDGTVRETLPKQKGDPRMEEAAINALRKWRFNPLPAKDARMQKGEIKMSFVIN